MRSRIERAARGLALVQPDSFNRERHRTLPFDKVESRATRPEEYLSGIGSLSRELATLGAAAPALFYFRLKRVAELDAAFPCPLRLCNAEPFQRFLTINSLEIS